MRLQKQKLIALSKRVRFSENWHCQSFKIECHWEYIGIDQCCACIYIRAYTPCKCKCVWGNYLHVGKM
jgi:hypothetical protein